MYDTSHGWRDIYRSVSCSFILQWCRDSVNLHPLECEALLKRCMFCVWTLKFIFLAETLVLWKSFFHISKFNPKLTSVRSMPFTNPLSFMFNTIKLLLKMLMYRYICESTTSSKQTSGLEKIGSSVSYLFQQTKRLWIKWMI